MIVEDTARPASGTGLARPDDIRLDVDPDELAAARFLVRYGEPTISGYRLSLRQWFEFCSSLGIRPLQADRTHVEVWVRTLEAQGIMASTINGKLNAVCGFYKLAKIDRAIVDNPTEHLRRPTVPRESRRQGMTRAEALAFLDAAKHEGFLEHALCCVLVLNGPRISEACRLNVEDVGWHDGYRAIYMTRSKGNRSGQVPLSPRTSKALDDYLGTRSDGPLFKKPRVDDRLDARAANLIVKRVTKRAGIGKHLTPHSCRHTAITMGLNSGVSIRDLVNSFGYADSRQIARYDRDKSNLARHATHFISAYIEGGV